MPDCMPCFNFAGFKRIQQIAIIDTNLYRRTIATVYLEDGRGLNLEILRLGGFGGFDQYMPQVLFFLACPGGTLYFFLYLCLYFSWYSYGVSEYISTVS